MSGMFRLLSGDGKLDLSGSDGYLPADNGLECSFEDLLSTCVELHVVDGFIQPNMKMVGKEEQCPFLNEKGRLQHPCDPSGDLPAVSAGKML